MQVDELMMAYDVVGFPFGAIALIITSPSCNMSLKTDVW